MKNNMKNSNLKYYNLDQNNSGGYYIRCADSNNEVDAFISIQAPNVKIAKMIAERILESYREYCPCCGERWSDEYLEEDDATDKPYVLSKPYDEQNDPFWCKNNKLVIYNYDGSKEIYDLNKNLKGDN